MTGFVKDTNILIDIQAETSFIKKIENNRWRILNNQMIFYDDDNITPLLTFDLKDAGGQPTGNNPKERTPA